MGARAFNIEAPNKQQLDAQMTQYLISYPPCKHDTLFHIPFQRSDGTWEVKGEKRTG